MKKEELDFAQLSSLSCASKS